jgi:hypothetical protein
MMVKRLKLATRAFGAEPGVPDAASLAEWIATHRGMAADIITCQLEASLSPQITAGIVTPCAGGKFYETRVLAALDGVKDREATRELHVDVQDIIEDAAGIVVQNKGAWSALPAPHLLGITDNYYNDRDEWNDSICGMYRNLMRAMRDTGVTGHVLICDSMQSAELAILARQKVFFYMPGMDRDNCATLMEYQNQIAIEKDAVDMVFDLTNEYTLRKIFLMDPDQKSIDRALSHLDPDQVVAGGYCMSDCGNYWKTLAEYAVYRK